MPMSNLYGGRCDKCNAWVPAEAGQAIKLHGRIVGRKQWAVRCTPCDKIANPAEYGLPVPTPEGAAP